MRFQSFSTAPVRKARSMRQDMPGCDTSDASIPLDVRFRKIAAERSIKVELPFFNQSHNGKRENRFAQRCRFENGRPGDRLLRRGVRYAELFEPRDASIANDGDRQSWDL